MSARPVQGLSHAPPDTVKLDRQIFAAALKSARCGLSPGLGGTRYEFLKACLEDDTAIELLAEACEHVAQGDMPQDIVDAMRLSRSTALRKAGAKCGASRPVALSGAWSGKHWRSNFRRSSGRLSRLRISGSAIDRALMPSPTSFVW